MLLSAIKNKLDLETMLKFTLPMNFFTGILTVSNNEFDDHAKNTVGISNFKCVINVLTLFGKFSSVFISQVQKFFQKRFVFYKIFAIYTFRRGRSACVAPSILGPICGPVADGAPESFCCSARLPIYL